MSASRAVFECEADVVAFIEANTAIESPPIVPEIKLHLATEITPLWTATETWLRGHGVPPPFWAFAWAGGQALARYVLDNADVVRDKRVVDLAAGSGCIGIAARKSGAAQVTAVDIDSFSATAIRLNAALNGVQLDVVCDDLLEASPPECDVILVGDVCYEKPMAERMLRFLHRCADAGREVLMGDPGRNYLDVRGMKRLAEQVVPTPIDLEAKSQRTCRVWRVGGNR